VIRPVVRRRALIIVLAAYAVGVAAITVLPIHRHPSAFWAGEPWWTMIHWIPFLVDAPSFALNVIMFVPFGVLVPVLWPRLDAASRLAGRALAVSTVIELTQLVLGVTLGSRRTVDVNDLIANTAGGLLGLLILRLALPSAAHRERIAEVTVRRAGSPR
jgi:glycopeptide antibiotics resistance protein